MMHQEHALAQAQLMLEKAGINPRDVAQFGLSEEGYLEFRRSPLTGKIVINPETETPAVRAKAWPEGFPFDEFIAQVHILQGAVR